MDINCRKLPPPAVAALPAVQQLCRVLHSNVPTSAPARTDTLTTHTSRENAANCMQIFLSGTLNIFPSVPSAGWSAEQEVCAAPHLGAGGMTPRL